MKEEQKIDRRVFDLYDEYCHGRMDRRSISTTSIATAEWTGVNFSAARRQ